MRIGKIGQTQLIMHNAFIGIMILFSLVGLLTKALTVFGCVLVHELAHAFVAMGYGLHVKEIELLPFGGVARIQGLTDIASSIEARIAIAGPLINFFLAGAAWTVGQTTNLDWLNLNFIMQTNVAIGAFNLLPALPLDGGRIYRAGLTKLVGYRQATERAANLGRLMAICLGGASLWSIYYGIINFTLLLLAIFLYIAANRERGMAAYICMQHLTRKKEELLRRGVLFTDQFTALPTTPLRNIICWFEPQKYHTVLVVEENCQVRCLLTEADIMDAIIKSGVDTPVGMLAGKEE